MDLVLENIHSRRAVRLFSSQKIPRDTMQEIINAGNAAPSGLNMQKWRFTVIDNPAIRRKFTELTIPQYKAWLAKAPAEVQKMRAEVDKQVDDPVYYSAAAVVFVIGHGMAKDLECPLVCQNMMLAARSLGIGSCWVHMGQLALANAEIRKLLEIKEGETVYGPVIFGYPKDGKFPDAPPKKPAVVKWA